MLNKILNERSSIYRYDKFISGFILGLIAPWLGVLLFYVAKFSYMPFSEYMNYVFNPRVFAPLLSLGIVMNLMVFFIFIWRNYYVSARAVILASILYIIPIVVAKFFL